MIRTQSQSHISNQSTPKQWKNLEKNGFLYQKYGECIADNFKFDLPFRQTSAAKIVLYMVSMHLTVTICNFEFYGVYWCLFAQLRSLECDTVRVGLFQK